MAGEIEEPFRFNFQAELLHSGSISFGRFESESLSWEKRSSFSHNRYLEEVEKYSKPGSVTEKKAYFEAHFRRKALLKQNSSECQEGREYQTSENDDRHDLEESENGNESRQSACFNESPHSSVHLGYNEDIRVHNFEQENMNVLYAENGHDSEHVACFDESPRSFGYDEESRVEECGRQNIEFFSVVHQDESVISMADQLVSVPEHVKLEDAHQRETENIVLVNTEEGTGKTLIDKVAQVDVLFGTIDSSLTSHSADKEGDHSSFRHRRTSSPKVRPAMESNTKPKLKSQENVSQVQTTISTETSKGSGKPRIKERPENDSLLVKKTEKKSPLPASPMTPITRSGAKTSKSEDLHTSVSKAKTLHPKKSIVKELRSEKAVESQSLSVEKSHPGVCSTPSRPKQINSLSKPRITQSAASFSFRSDQRAERRKEFYMKLEEKMHSKEVEINKIEEQRREKEAAEMKQSRKSLNFKATPMPAFYNGPAPGLDRNKVISTNKTPNRPRTASSRPVAKPTERFSSNSAVPSNTRPSSSTSSTNRTRHLEAARKTYVPEKKEQEKKKDLSSHRQERKGPIARDISRKDAKGVHMGKWF